MIQISDFNFIPIFTLKKKFKYTILIELDMEYNDYKVISN